MADIRVLTALMKSFFNAEELSQEEITRWIADNEEPIIGYSFPDAQKNYYLLTVNDLNLLTEEQKEMFFECRVYPFMGIKAIVYRNKDNNVDLRIINGIGSALGNLFAAWCRWDSCSEE